MERKELSAGFLGMLYSSGPQPCLRHGLVSCQTIFPRTGDKYDVIKLHDWYKVNKNTTHHYAKLVWALSLFICKEPLPSRGEGGEPTTPDVCLLCPVWSVTEFWPLSLQKTCVTKMTLATEAAVSELILAISGYSALIFFIQNTGRVVAWIFPLFTFRPNNCSDFIGQLENRCHPPEVTEFIEQVEYV